MTDEQFQEIVDRCGDTVFRLAYSYLKNRADAEDVMQETLLKRCLETKPETNRPLGGRGRSRRL